jgi:hypothetical protein
VTYLFIANRDFWQVVASIHDSGFDAAKSAGDEVSAAIDQLAFLRASGESRA